LLGAEPQVLNMLNTHTHTYTHTHTHTYTHTYYSHDKWSTIKEVQSAVRNKIDTSTHVCAMIARRTWRA